MKKNVYFPIRLESEQEREYWHKKAKEHGFDSLAQFIRWLIHNSDRLLNKVINKD